MENAAKALLIGGCITLSVLIVSIGIYVVKANDTTDEASAMLSSIEIKMHNARYEVLEGLQSGRDVKTLLNYAIDDNNKLGEDARIHETEKLCVNIRSNDTTILNAFKSNSEMKKALTTRDHGVRYAENIRQIIKVIQTNRKYKIWYSYSKSGYIWEIHIDTPGT